MENIIKLTFGIILGAVVGAVAASLLTPKSGEEIRNEILGSIDEIKLDYELERQRKREEMEADLRRRWGE